MINTVEQLKKERPNLVKDFEAMSREQLLEQIYLECMDAINMEERVQTFMSECTDMSYTTYTPEVIKGLVQDKYNRDISEWCQMTLEDADGDDEYILEEVRNTADKR
jgi:hypothetical protein